VRRAQERFGVSESRACRALGQSRTTQRYKPKRRIDEDVLTTRIIELGAEYGRYGYRRIAAMLQHEGWQVNHKRVERIWRAEGFKVPQRQKKRRRLWLNDGSCIRLRPEYRNHEWSYDFVQERTHDGRAFRILSIIDEYSRECLCAEVGRILKAEEVLETLTGLFCRYGTPDYIRSDNKASVHCTQGSKVA